MGFPGSHGRADSQRKGIEENRVGRTVRLRAKGWLPTSTLAFPVAPRTGAER